MFMLRQWTMQARQWAKPWWRSMSTEVPKTGPDSKIIMPGILTEAAPETATPEISASLESYTGRSLGKVANPHTAYRRLHAILAQNKVRREIRANMYYEKPNVARRRKKIESNRRIFGAMVRKKVALILQMKQRGM